MDIKDLEKINSELDEFGADPGISIDFISHKIREKAEKTVREEKQVELLAELLQSNKDADKKADIMLFVVIVTCVISFLALMFK